VRSIAFLLRFLLTFLKNSVTNDYLRLMEG